MLHKVVAGSRKYVLLTALTLLGLLIFVSTVFAHHPEVSGRAVCNTQTGDYQITWTVENSESAAGRTMTIVSATRGSGYASTVAPSGSTQGTEIVGGTTNGTLTNTVVASWFYASNAPKNVSRSGSVRLDGTCAPPTLVPTVIPTVVPTLEPTDVPTLIPTDQPTTEPTLVPTDQPTSVPTLATTEPTTEPTLVSTDQPTSEPTLDVTDGPTPVRPQPTVVVTDPPYNPTWACKFESIAQYWYFKNVPGGWTFGSVPYQAQESTNIWIGGDGNAPIGSVFEVYVYDSVGNPADESSYSYLATFMVNANNDCSQNDPGAEPTPRPMPASGSGELPGTGGHDSNTGVLIMIALAGGGVIWFLRRSRATIAS